MKKFVWFGALMALAILFSSCGANRNEELCELELSRVSDREYLQELEGKTVEFCGFVIAEGAEDASFVYVTNIPDQLAPFCEPNSKVTSNAVMVKFKKSVKYEEGAEFIKVSGVLCLAEENEYFRDELGYDSSFYIEDAKYSVEKAANEDALALVKQMGEEEIASELYRMYEYVNFLCSWDRHYVPNKIDENGNKTPGYYLYASDAKNLIIRDKAKWNYGYKEGYFKEISDKLKELDEEKLATLISNVNKAEQLAQKAFSALENGEYTSEYRYISIFDNYDYVYTITDRESFAEEYRAIFEEFTSFLGSL